MVKNREKNCKKKIVKNLKKRGKEDYKFQFIDLFFCSTRNISDVKFSAHAPAYSAYS